MQLGALALVVGSLALDNGGIFLIPLVFVLVVPFERMFPRHDQPIRRKHLGLDMTYAVAGPVLTLIGTVAIGLVAVLTLAWLPGLAFRPLVAAMPPLMQLIVGFLLFDFLIYWAHRWSHEVPFLWRFHSVHHSVEHMDWVSGFRNHPIDGAILAPPIAFLLAAGFSPEATGVFAILQIVTGLFLHANVRWRLRPIQRLIITPEFHHWHHTNEAAAINTNYSVFLPAWDIVFGTWFMPKDRRPQVYGIDEPIPSGLLPQLFFPFRGLRSPLWMLRHPIKGFTYTLRLMKSGAKQLWRSTRRPTRRAAVSTATPV